MTSNESLRFAIQAIQDEATKPLHVEIERLQRELDGANKTIALFMGPDGEKHIERFAVACSRLEPAHESGIKTCPTCRHMDCVCSTAPPGVRPCPWGDHSTIRSPYCPNCGAASRSTKG